MRGAAVKERKRAEAEARQAERDARSDAEQLARLEANGHGECREAARLRDRIDKENAK